MSNEKKVEEIHNNTNHACIRVRRRNQKTDKWWTSGGPIGMEITGTVAQVFMVWWDPRLRERLNVINIQLPLHKRYIDDLAAQRTEVRAR